MHRVNERDLNVNADSSCSIVKNSRYFGAKVGEGKALVINSTN